jgi:hypothetical protein
MIELFKPRSIGIHYPENLFPAKKQCAGRWRLLRAVGVSCGRCCGLQGEDDRNYASNKKGNYQQQPSRVPHGCLFLSRKKIALI